MRRFFGLLLLNILISAGISCAIWARLGKGFANKDDFINIDFFNTVGVSFTIVGFVIAIYQIAELRREQQIRNDAIGEFKVRYFKNDALYNLGYVKPHMQLLQREINLQLQFSEPIIYSYISSLNVVNHMFGNIASQQQNIGCPAIINCEDLITLLGEITDDFHDVVSQNGYKTFPKQRFNAKIGVLIGGVSACEAKLKA